MRVWARRAQGDRTLPFTPRENRPHRRACFQAHDAETSKHMSGRINIAVDVSYELTNRCWMETTCSFHFLTEDLLALQVIAPRAPAPAGDVRRIKIKCLPSYTDTKIYKSAHLWLLECKLAFRLHFGRVSCSVCQSTWSYFLFQCIITEVIFAHSPGYLQSSSNKNKN